MFEIKQVENRVVIENTENGRQLVISTYKMDLTAMINLINIFCNKDGSNYITKYDLANKYPKLAFSHAVNKGIGDIIGVSMFKFKNMLAGAYYRTYIDPYRPVSDWLVISKNGPISSRTINMINNWNIIKECLSDRQENLIPMVTVTGKKVQELSKTFSKKSWKKVANNSRSRNLAIISLWEYCLIDNPLTNFSSFVTAADKLPSTLLKKFSISRLVNLYLENRINNIIPKFIKYKSKIPLSKITSSDINSFVDFIGDTFRLCDDSGRLINKDWSINRLKEVHAEEVVKLQEKNYPKYPFKYIKFLPNKIEYGGFTANLVDSPYKLYILGREEGHCVASYSNLALDGNYAVYVVEKTANSKRSVIGIAHPDKSDIFDQHYHKYNKQVVDEGRISFGNKISNKVKNLLLENVVVTKTDENFPVPPANFIEEDIPF